MRTQFTLAVAAAALVVAGMSGCGDNNGNGNGVTTNDVKPGPKVSCSPGTRPGSTTAQTGEDRKGCDGFPITPSPSGTGTP
jgi:hypothetical protein